MVPHVLTEALDAASLTAADVDHLLLHQANIRIMEVVAKRLKVSECSEGRIPILTPAREQPNLLSTCKTVLLTPRHFLSNTFAPRFFLDAADPHV